ncbi:MAG: hypothetical protein HXX20_02125 [Chloroflexi bacterium]|nr:hypothetical protein [Chloroflexota bacterium]
MKITEVRIEMLFNLGNYENKKIGLSAELAEGESPAEAMALLEEELVKQAGSSAISNLTRRRGFIKELGDLEYKINKARAEWAKVEAFMVGKEELAAKFPEIESFKVHSVPVQATIQAMSHPNALDSLDGYEDEEDEEDDGF